MDMDCKEGKWKEMVKERLLLGDISRGRRESF
jgi:hypothetical protein